MAEAPRQWGQVGAKSSLAVGIPYSDVKHRVLEAEGWGQVEETVALGDLVAALVQPGGEVLHLSACGSIPQRSDVCALRSPCGGEVRLLIFPCVRMFTSPT